MDDKFKQIREENLQFHNNTRTEVVNVRYVSFANRKVIEQQIWDFIRGIKK